MEAAGDALPQYSSATSKSLEEFASAWVNEEAEQVPPVLCSVIEEIAKSGLSCYSWEHLKVLIEAFFVKVLREFGDTDKASEEDRELLFEELRQFADPPFTLQRICELLVSPSVYRSSKVWVFSVNKLVNVALTEDTLEEEQYNKTVKQMKEAYGAVVSVERLGSSGAKKKGKSEEGDSEDQEQMEESTGGDNAHENNGTNKNEPKEQEEETDSSSEAMEDQDV